MANNNNLTPTKKAKTSNKETFSDINVKNPNRVARYAGWTRERMMALSVVTTSKSTNQYTKLSFEEEFNFVYLRMHRHSLLYLADNDPSSKTPCPDLKEHPALERFCCYVPEGSGFDSGAYVRTNLMGTKHQCHVLAYLYERIGLSLDVEKDLSHLCGRGTCARGSHLTEESRQENIDRRKCGGYLYDMKTKSLYCLCIHPKKCQFVRVVSNLADLIVVNSES